MAAFSKWYGQSRAISARTMGAQATLDDAVSTAPIKFDTETCARRALSEHDGDRREA